MKSATESCQGFSAPPGPKDSLQQWNKALNTPSQVRLRPPQFSTNEGLAHVLNVQPCLVTFYSRIDETLLLLLPLLPRPRQAAGPPPHTPPPFERLDAI